MLRFLVFDEHGPAADWPLSAAHLIGPDETALRGTVEFDATTCQIVAHPPQERNAGLAVTFDAGPMGELMLHTSLLPQREQPYRLSLELARHRIKMFIVKSEEWQMFDLSAEHPATQLWEEARQLFTEAMITLDPLQSDRKAREALTRGIEATERLALAHADILLHRRFQARAAGPATLGVQVWPGRDSERLKEVIKSDFDLLAVPFRWRELEVREGEYNWEPYDRWMNWAAAARVPVLAGPLLDFSKRALPEWMYVWQHDYGTCRDLAYDHVEQVVKRYAGAVSMWNLASGININSNFRFKEDQMLDLIRMAHLAVRQEKRNARCMVELTQPFGEHVSFCKGSIEPFTFVDRLFQEGIRVDTIGLQVIVGSARPGQFTRDLMQLSAMLDRFFPLEVKLVISMLGAPSMAGETTSSNNSGGHWHERWNADQQSRWLSRAFGICMSKPFVETVIWNTLYDHAAALLPYGGLFDEAGHAKPAFSKLISIRKRLRKPLGSLTETSHTASMPAAGQEHTRHVDQG